MFADAAIPPATPSSAVQKLTPKRTRATSGIGAQALANTARDKVHLQARNKTLFMPLLVQSSTCCRSLLVVQGR